MYTAITMVSPSLTCFNGTRFYCCPAAKERNAKQLAIFIIIFTCIVVATIINIERQSFRKTESIKEKYYGDVLKSKFKEQTDLEDDSLSYAIVFDCGSSGSRVYIYFWPPHGGDSKELLDIHQVIGADNKPLSKKIAPGLSTYNTNTTNAAEYLRPLLEYVADIIPEHKHKQTPLYILATAGMRLIEDSDAKAILDDITKDIPKWFNFHFEPTHAEILSGQSEGMYAWMSLNYMLGRFSHSGPSDTSSYSTTKRITSSDHLRKQSVGVVDMGGGSLQIAFEVPSTVNVKDNPLVKTFNLGCTAEDTDHKYSLYVTTFLGYGANSALNRYRQNLVQKQNSNLSVVPDPCLSYGDQASFVDNGRSYQLRGTGRVTSCLKNVYPLLDKATQCHLDPCSLNGVHQPPIPSQSEFYGISEYWYSVYDVFLMKDYYDKDHITHLAETYCATAWNTTMKQYKKNLYPNADMERMRTECFKVSWILTVLYKGLMFPDNYRSFKPVNEINGQEVQWSLGALLHKTACMPVKSKHEITSNPIWVGKTHQLLPYALVMCILVVLVAIFLYCRRLQRMKVVPSLRNVPSMSYFMTGDDQVEQGLVSENRYYP